MVLKRMIIILFIKKLTNSNGITYLEINGDFRDFGYNHVDYFISIYIS